MYNSYSALAITVTASVAPITSIISPFTTIYSNTRFKVQIKDKDLHMSHN